MKSKMDLLIERLIRSKYKNIENARKDKRIYSLLSGKIFSELSKKEKEELIKILLS
jgi:hypothetical protein